MEGEANNKLLDEEDTQRSNLNSKYVRLNSCAKYSNSLICFLLCLILVTHDVILRYEACVNALGASTFDK